MSVCVFLCVCKDGATPCESATTQGRVQIVNRLGLLLCETHSVMVEHLLPFPHVQLFEIPAGICWSRVRPGNFLEIGRHERHLKHAHVLSQLEYAKEVAGGILTEAMECALQMLLNTTTLFYQDIK